MKPELYELLLEFWERSFVENRFSVFPVIDYLLEGEQREKSSHEAAL